MDKSDLKILFKNLKNLSNQELNSLTLEVLQNNTQNNLINNFSKKYTSKQLVNGINKINFNLFGGEDEEVNEGIDETSALKIELDGARKRIAELNKENAMLVRNKADRKSMLQLEQKHKETINKLGKRTKKLQNLESSSEKKSQKAEALMKKLQTEREKHTKSLKEAIVTKGELKKERSNLKAEKAKLKGALKELSKKTKVYNKNMKVYKELKRQNEQKNKNLNALEKVLKSQQKKQNNMEKSILANGKANDDARTRLKIQAEELQQKKKDTMEALKTGLTSYKKYLSDDAKDDKNESDKVQNQLVNSLKAISKLKTKINLK